MSLVTVKEIARVVNLDKYGFVGFFFGWIVLKILRISKINSIYNKHKHLKDLDFVNALLNDFHVNFKIPEKDLRRIPKDSPFVTVSNHPFGGIEGLMLLKSLSNKCPDYKIIANFLLQRFEPLKSFIIPVNPFEDRKEAKSSISGLKMALHHLKNGYPLGVFRQEKFQPIKMVIKFPIGLGTKVSSD